MTMTTSLSPMSEASYERYLAVAIPAYANDNVESGRWDKTDALERSRAAHEKLLPDGIDTDKNYLFDIRHNQEDQVVGYIWVCVDDTYHAKTAFIFDLEIFEEYRRKGFARSALLNVEDFLKEMDVVSLGLHVFHYNDAARTLYSELGYDTVSMNMQKALSKERPGKGLDRDD